MKSHIATTIAIAIAMALSLPTVGNAKDTVPAGQVSGLQIAVGDCLTVPNPPARTRPSEPTTKGLLDEVAKALISEGVNYLGRALTEAGKAKTSTISGARNLQAPNLNGLGNCVQVVRGRFDATGKSIASWKLPSPWPATTDSTLRARGIVAVDEPDFMFEGIIMQSDDGSSYTIRPATFTYNGAVGEKASEGQVRHVALFFALTGPGVKATADNAPATNIVIGRIPTGTTIQYGVPPTGYSSPYEPIWFSLSQDLKKPVTINVVESNTREERAFLSFLGKILSNDKVKGELVSPAQQIFIPSVAQQAAANDASAAVISSAEMNSKMASALSALQTCVAANEAALPNAGKDAYAALSAYLAADLKLENPAGSVDQRMIEKMDAQRPPASIRQGCTDAYAALKKPG